MKKCFFILIPALALFLSSCFKDPKPQACNYDPCSYKAPAAEIAAVQHYLDSAGITGATQHCSGLFYKIDNPGTGKTPEACQNVNVTYKGMLTNGHAFDSSKTGIDLSLARVIQGWTNGVPLLKQNGKITLYIPPSLGYGADPIRDRNNPSVVIIPGNSILIFDIGLVTVY